MVGTKRVHILIYDMRSVLSFVHPHQEDKRAAEPRRKVCSRNPHKVKKPLRYGRKRVVQSA